MHKEIDVFEYMNTILRELKKGILLTTKNGDRVNAMTISWGQIGIEWNKLIFTTYVREGRFTKDMLSTGEFTINIPLDRKNVAKAIAYCGIKSGREFDKTKDVNFSLVDGRKVDVPAIKELPLTLECKVVYKQIQDKNEIEDDICNEFYPQDVPSDHFGANKDYHIMFYGEIVDSYILE